MCVPDILHECDVQYSIQWHFMIFYGLVWKRGAPGYWGLLQFAGGMVEQRVSLPPHRSRVSGLTMSLGCHVWGVSGHVLCKVVWIYSGLSIFLPMQGDGSATINYPKVCLVLCDRLASHLGCPCLVPAVPGTGSRSNRISDQDQLTVHLRQDITEQLRVNGLVQGPNHGSLAVM